ncbi:hypothetical protein BFJ66_g18101 [Fusarium oxysporum f. sp. cepae]|nr:hypothetical protein BFJ66_g18101 [Fusarium oxysporum f. sp. cepae]
MCKRIVRYRLLAIATLVSLSGLSNPLKYPGWVAERGHWATRDAACPRFAIV